MRILIIVFFLLTLGSCDAAKNDDVLQGYVEGRQLNLAPRAMGIITALNVREGDQVKAGTLLFSVDAERAQAHLDETMAAYDAAAARLANLRKGGRSEEIKAAGETLKETQAALILAQQTYDRSKILLDKGAIAVTRLDQDRAALDASRARMTEAKSRLALIRLPARADLITAGERDVDFLKASVERSRLDLEDRSVVAPAEGRVETIYRRKGEIAGPTQPVLALLPPDQKRIRFFVPEPLLSRVHYGDRVTLMCDSCPHDLSGKITFISNQAEFTPPIIFTEKERAKLVYLVEARPDQPDQFLNGQPVDVTLP